MSLQLSFAEASATGPREENQDALRLVTPTPALAASKGYLFAIADGVSQCADGGLAARSTLQALALDYYATPETWGSHKPWIACCWPRTAGCRPTVAGNRY
jgi:serine/threonine protein phosphatase PrpC